MMMMIIIFVGKPGSIKIKSWTTVSSSKKSHILIKIDYSKSLHFIKTNRIRFIAAFLKNVNIIIWSICGMCILDCYRLLC